jgi:hypothetical protein
MADENLPLPASRGTNEGLVLDNTVFRIDKGRVAPPSTSEEPRPPRIEHIPWGYGRDLIKAMVVDPNRLFLYWEATDPAIAKARQGLGAGGKDAWLTLRIYDTTGRIFDGTNAHSYFDIKVERSDRQWFVHIGKPASTHVVELGMKSLEGYFVRIVRSGRADFPRFEPSADGTADWLAVRTRTGPVGGSTHGHGGSGGEGGGGAPGGGHAAGGGPGTTPGGPGGGGPGGFETTMWQEHTVAGPVHLTEWSWQGWQEVFQTQWIEGRRFLEWSTPLLRTNWEAGPFPFAVESPGVVEEHFEGPVTIYPLEGGRTRVVYGPWQVTIRGLGARAEGRVIARWEVETSWVVSMGFERVVRELSPRGGAAAAGAPGEAVVMLGGSEAAGASEGRWLSASELRLRGASEIHMMSASEIRLRGASEVVLGGASERRLAGASERRWVGASEFRWAGGSEVAWAGASENIALGASERMGSSERMAGSESRLGSSENRATSPYAIDESESRRREKG